MLHIILPENRIVDVKDGPTGVPEYMFNALVLQTLNDDLATTQFHFAAPHRPNRPFKSANQAKN
ncbi:MAG: hypothetical protein AB2814_04930 [Candidatus Sedimenticola endophacoides]